MEKLPIELKGLSSLIVAFIEKVQILDSVVSTTQKKSECVNELTEIVVNFRSFFEKVLKPVEINEQTKIFKDRIERAFSRFEWDANVGVSSHEFQKHSINAKTLLSAVLKILGMKGCGILIIEIYLELCIKIINGMETATISFDQSKDKSNFKLLLDGVLSTANMFKKYWHISLLPNHRHSVALCLSQLCKLLPFLLKMIQKKNVDVKNIILRILKQCLNRILSEIHSEGDLQPKDCGQEFITLMDFSLNKLNNLANDKMDFHDFVKKAEQVTQSVKPMIDEVLCYGMSISHVTQSNSDRSAIMSSSLKVRKHLIKVIREYKDLVSSLSDCDVNNIKLNAQSVGESLCALERHVNRAVLRLVLEVFTGINCPLKNIINKCRTSIEKDNKTSDDLNSLISDFDSEMDKIMQIGLFAISCSSDSGRILGIQSCLASLEYLENELILSLRCLYMSCDSKTKSNFEHLINMWLSEMTELKLFIDSIIDPAGFCEIVENTISFLMVDLKKALFDDVCLTEANSTILKIIRYSKKLIKTLKKNLEDNEIAMDVEEYLLNFQLAVQDCEAVYKKLQSGEDGNRLIDKVYEKSEFLHEELKKLACFLFVLVIDEKSETECEDDTFKSSLDMNSVVPKRNYYKFCFSTIEEPQTPETSEDMEVLTPYISKGKVKSHVRSVMYTVPSEPETKLKEKLDVTLLQAKHWEKTPVSKKRSRCCKPLNIDLELSNTVDLEITSVLENLSHLNGTFAKNLSEPENMGENDVNSIKGKGNQIGPTFRNSGCCANFDSVPETKPTTETNDRLTGVTAQKLDEAGDKCLPGTILRNRFLRSLDNLSRSESLILSKEGDEINTDLDTPDRLNDLKLVEEKIDFIKQQVPSVLP